MTPQLKNTIHERLGIKALTPMQDLSLIHI